MRKRNDLQRINSITSINDVKPLSKTQQEEILTHAILEYQEEQQANILDNYEVVNENYTKGIEINQCTFAGSHHFSIWEFSGYEPYNIFYDYYIGGQNCINIVLYNLNQTTNECFKECVYWLEFLRARVNIKHKPESLAIDTPSGSSSSNGSSAILSNELENGDSAIIAANSLFAGKMKILLIGTHADLDKASALSSSSSSSASSSSNASAAKQKSPDEFQGQYCNEKSSRVKSMLENYYANDDLFDLSENHFVLDARAAWVSDIKQLTQYLIKRKQHICEKLPRCTMFLNRTLFHIQNWRKSLANTASTNLANGTSVGGITSSSTQLFSFKIEPRYPVMSWKNFVEQIREEINPLASDDHLFELMHQLQLMGK